MTDDGTTGLPDGSVDADDPWFHFVYDDSWRIVATYRADHAGAWTIDGDPKERFVYHNAGLDGYGGSSYIDAVILRERDADNTGAWAGTPDGTLEERTYYVQNWRADVVALFTDAGALIQQVRYDPYGVPFGIPKTDVTGDGIVDTQDLLRWVGSDIYNGGAGTHPYADWDLDGDVDSADQTAYSSDRSTDTSLGRGVLGYEFDRVGGNNRKAYAGYEGAPEIEGVKPGTYHVRHRVYLAESGRWTRRDPLGYIDSLSLYDYGLRRPMLFVDSLGLASGQGGSGGFGCGVCGGDGPIPPSIPDDLDDDTKLMCTVLEFKMCRSQEIVNEACAGVKDQQLAQRVRDLERRTVEAVQQWSNLGGVTIDLLAQMFGFDAAQILAHLQAGRAAGMSLDALMAELDAAKKVRLAKQMTEILGTLMANPITGGLSLWQMRDALRDGRYGDAISAGSSAALDISEIAAMALQFAKRQGLSGGLKLGVRAIPIAGWIALAGEAGIGLYQGHLNKQIRLASNRSNPMRCRNTVEVHEIIVSRFETICLGKAP